jgi:nucleoside-diphosphate-sugar epimerase
VLVTGAAGFIGSHLCEALLGAGYRVTGIDAFDGYYSPRLKEENIRACLAHPRFEMRYGDLLDADLPMMLAGAEAVIHLAALPGVRASWGPHFDTYLRHNVETTQRLLAAAGPSLRKFILASSSSVYGEAEELPLQETAPPRPISPYGVTKLAAEQLVRLYRREGMSGVCLRLFTVYGPRQRPDMAIARFLRAMLAGESVPVYGDGSQTRDFTYVTDAVAACMRALRAETSDEALNVGSGQRTSLNELLVLLQEVTGRSLRVDRQAPQRGDAQHTWADIERARRALDYRPTVSLAEGLALQAASLAPGKEQ